MIKPENRNQVSNVGWLENRFPAPFQAFGGLRGPHVGRPLWTGQSNHKSSYLTRVGFAGPSDLQGSVE